MATGSTALVLWSVAIGLIAGAVSAWSRLAWRGVDVQAAFRPRRAFAGEPVTLTVRISNRKRLPLFIVRLGIWLPSGLMPNDGTPMTTIRGFQRKVSVPGRSEVTLELPVRVGQRGEYWLERVEVQLTDPFDMNSISRDMKPEADLVVMPEPRIPIPVEVRRRLPFGSPARAHRIFEARERFAGVRPYAPGDPLNRIHWKLTGHSGGLQTKLFEPTRNADVLFALDLTAGEPFWDNIYPEIAVDTIAWASFLARQAISAGWRAGLVANTHLKRGGGPLRVPAGSSPGYEAALFSALARMPNEATGDLAPVLREISRRSGRITTTVVIAPRPGYWLRHEMGALRGRGSEVVHLSPLEVAV